MGTHAYYDFVCVWFLCSFPQVPFTAKNIFKIYSKQDSVALLPSAWYFEQKYDISMCRPTGNSRDSKTLWNVVWHLWKLILYSVLCFKGYPRQYTTSSTQCSIAQWETAKLADLDAYPIVVSTEPCKMPMKEIESNNWKMDEQAPFSVNLHTEVNYTPIKFLSNSSRMSCCMFISQYWP